MGWNVPDDWGSYYSRCSLCGTRYHASEGGCGCTEDKEFCVGPGCNDRNSLDSYHDHQKVTDFGGGRFYCDDCIGCECCEDGKDVSWDAEAGLLLCKRCEPEDHWCPSQGPLLEHLEKVTRD